MLRLLSVLLEPNEIHYICFILLQLLSKLPLCLLGFVIFVNCLNLFLTKRLRRKELCSNNFTKTRSNSLMSGLVFGITFKEDYFGRWSHFIVFVFYNFLLSEENDKFCIWCMRKVKMKIKCLFSVIHLSLIVQCEIFLQVFQNFSFM